MKTLLFLRHGKSDWSADFDHDHERPLAKRGRKAAQKMGRYLKASSQEPDGILTSTAVRARDTVRIAAEAGKWSADIREDDELYDADPSTILTIVRSEPDTTDRLLLVGHEPTWSRTIGQLIGTANVRFPTAAVACISFDMDSWVEANFDRGQLIWLMPPKLMPDD